jgi:copper(I)-binding protein
MQSTSRAIVLSASNQPRRRCLQLGQALGLCLAMALHFTPALAHDARVGSLHITHPAAPATLPGQTSGAVYLGIENEGKQEDRLLSASSPAAASVAIHRMSMTDNIMRMREIDNLPLPVGSKVVINADSGTHLMLTGLKQPLAAGDKIPLTLRFEHAGAVEVSIHVGPSPAQANQAGKADAHAGHAH